MQETQNTEFKREWRDEWLKWISGFANAKGGTLLVGVDDNGAAVGLSNAKKLLEDLPNKVRDVLGILVDVNLLECDEKQLLEINVPASSNAISYKGEFYYRSGSTNQELKGSSLQHFLLKKHGMHWDAVTLERPDLESLKSEEIARFKRMAVNSNRLDEDALAYTDKEILEKLLLVDGDELKRAAVLLFHHQPERYISNAFVKIGLFVDEHANMRHFDEIRGTLFEQVFNTIEVMKLKYLKAEISFEDIVRKETFPVPLEALREALLNAVVHKDYATAAPIQISVYPNRIMIWNPGYLPDNWTMEMFLNKHSSRPFNPDIANAFFRSGLIETWGRGIERIQEACEKADVPEPEWQVTGNDFWTTFYFAESAGAESEDDAGQVTGQVTGQVAGQVKQLLLLLTEELSRKEMMEKLGLKGRDNFEKLYLTPALKGGLVEMTIPDKPNSRLQKYRLTKKGKQLASTR